MSALPSDGAFQMRRRFWLEGGLQERTGIHHRTGESACFIFRTSWARIGCYPIISLHATIQLQNLWHKSGPFNHLTICVKFGFARVPTTVLSVFFYLTWCPAAAARGTPWGSGSRSGLWSMSGARSRYRVWFHSGPPGRASVDDRSRSRFSERQSSSSRSSDSDDRRRTFWQAGHGERDRPHQRSRVPLMRLLQSTPDGSMGTYADHIIVEYTIRTLSGLAITVVVETSDNVIGKPDPGMPSQLPNMWCRR